MLIEVGLTVPYQPIHINAAGVRDYAIPLTLEYERLPSVWTGQCRETGTATFAETKQEVQEALEANVLLQLSELESLSDLPAHLEQWGIVPVPLDPPPTADSPAPAGKGSIAAPLKKNPERN